MANEVKVILSAIDKASAVLTKAGKDISGFGRTADAAVKGLTGFSLASLGGAAAVGAVAKAVGDSIKHFTTYAEQVRTMSAATGMSNEETSKMIQLFDDANVDIGLFTRASRTMVAQGLQPSVENMAKLADEFNALQDPVAKSQLLIKNFGMSGMAMGKLMAMGGDAIKEAGKQAERFGQVLDDEAIAAAEEYRLEMDDLNDAVEGVKIQIGKGLIPVMADLARSINEGIASSMEYEDVMSRYILLWSEGVIVGDRANDVLTEMARAGEISAEGIEILNDAEARLVDHSRLAVEYLGKQTDAEYDLAEAEQALKDAADKTAGIYRDIEAALRDSNVPLHEKIKLLEELALASGKTTEEELAMDKAVKFLTRSLELGYISQDQYMDITGEMATAALDGSEAVRAIESAIKDNTTAAGNASEPVSALSGHMGDLEESAADAKAEVNFLKGSIDKLNDKTITITTNYVQGGTIPSGAPAPRPRRKKQFGGPVAANVPYLVGEAGPEMFIPKTSGDIVPNNKIGSKSGVSIGEINVYASDSMDEESLAQLVIARLNAATRTSGYAGLDYAG